MNMLSCRTEVRREAVRNNPGWNGLDFVEVDDTQTLLSVYFLGKAPEGIVKENFEIEGGRTEDDQVHIVSIDIQRAEEDYVDDRVLVHVDKPGDYSTYTLRLLGVEGIDPRYASLEFSFKANCPTDLDCAPQCSVQPQVFTPPVIDYLAKDYAGFRQLILDRLSLICPDWTERHVPDLGIALVELLAYTGDYLSYYQDAVATEAYLDTARRRPSVRRHAKLVDYVLSEGCNARALVAVETQANVHFSASKVRFITGVNHLIPVESRAALQWREIEMLPATAYEIFEPVTWEPEIYLYKNNNRIRFYTWGDRECCIRKGATQAALWGRLADADLPSEQQDLYNDPYPIRLKPGAFLIFEEVIGPVTGKPGDADPTHRQVVRLTAVRQRTDELLDQPFIEIEWNEEDALQFDLCISAVGAAPECEYLEDISIARGNVVLVDHGRRVGPEDLGIVPTRTTTQCCECEGQPSETSKVPGRYRPQLQSRPLTFAVPISAMSPAADLFFPDARKAVPVAVLSSQDGDWQPCIDLLSSSGSDRRFVVELEENGVANVLFGNGELGKQPEAGAAFTARYRVGNGPAGNVGAGAISVLVHDDSDLSNDITRVWNPLPAAGGTAAEPMAEAKLNAPFAFRYGAEAMQRAITADDYARIAERNARIQRAAARLVWSGSWYEADVGIDVKAVYAADVQTVADAVEFYLEAFRRIGHDLNVRPAEYLPIDLALEVCIAPEYLRGHVKATLLDAFSNRTLKGGALGFFHPDNLTFGNDIYLSAIIATAQVIPGVVSVKVKRLQRQFYPPNQEIEQGLLPLGPFRIAQLDGDPNHPDHGRLEIRVVGGR